MEERHLRAPSAAKVLPADLAVAARLRAQLGVTDQRVAERREAGRLEALAPIGSDRIGGAEREPRACAVRRARAAGVDGIVADRGHPAQRRGRLQLDLRV